MKKYKKILFGVIAALVLCVTSVNFSEASVKTDQKNAIKAYRSLVQDGSCYYKIVDINGDNVKDLLLMDKSYEYAEVGYYKVYTYRNGKLKCLKKFDYCRGGNLYYNTKKHMVIMVRGLFGGRETYVYTAQKNSLKKISKFTIDYEATSTGKKTIYRINGKKVSKSKYIKTLSALEKSCKKVRPDDYYIL